MMEILTIAQAAPAGQVSGEVLIAVIGAIFSGVSLMLGKMLGKKEATAMRVESPVPTIPTMKIPAAVSWNDLHPIVQRIDRMERHLDEVRKEQAEQFREILEAGATRADRLTHHMDDVARAIHARIDGLMTKPTTNRRA